MAGKKCWIDDTAAPGFYFIYGPIAVMTLVTAGFYFVTGRRIYLVQHETCDLPLDECDVHSYIKECSAR